MGSLARRMVVTADADRRRLERALHDGAQQRLAAVATTLALARRRLEGGEEGALDLVVEAGEEAKRCLDDLRDLARDIYPAVLAERGLPGALADLVRRAPGYAELVSAPSERLPEPVELTAYSVVSETLSRLPEGGDATVAAEVSGGSLVVRVQGATLSGEQLERLGDRVGALDGRLEARGDPAHVHAIIPAGAPSPAG